MITYTVQHFQPKEFRCPCCGQGSPARLLVFWLDLFRRAWGGPVRVNSGYRCQKHNAEVGGVESSRHLLGCAADIRPVDPALLGPFQNLAAAFFHLPGWECIRYPWGMHVAVPRTEYTLLWEGGVLHVAA